MSDRQADPSAASTRPREPPGGPEARFLNFLRPRLVKPGVPIHSRAVFDAAPPRRAALLEAYRARVQAHYAGPEEGMAVSHAPTPVGSRRKLRLAAPAMPGVVNWSPLGPSVVLHGMAGTRLPVSGRVMSLAVSADGQRVYVGSANGGVWRSDDAGRTFYPLMNAFDLQPTTNHADSLSVGAIAVPTDRPDRVYVGSGEGDLSPDNFPRGVGGGSYNGVGPVVSFDGGASWCRESGDPGIQQGYFFALAVDPTDPERVLAATARSLYRRQPRNLAVPGLPAARPQAYVFKYASSSGAYAVSYWDPAGNADFVVQRGAGGGALPSGAVVEAFVQDSTPWLLVYVPTRRDWFFRQVGGDYWAYVVQGDGALVRQGAGHWATGLLLMSFQLCGRAHLVRYDPSSGMASLSRWSSDGTLTDIWVNQPWGAGLTQLIPFEIDGVPHFLTYAPAGILAKSQAMLWRWSGSGQRSRVWVEPDHDLGSATTFVTFELDTQTYLQAYEADSFQTRIARWNADGRLTWVLRSPVEIAGGRDVRYEAFVLGGSVRLLAYDARRGTAAVSALSLADAGTELVRTTLFVAEWEPGLTFTSFAIGYEWRALNLGFAPVDARTTSVVVARRADVTAFFAAFWDGGIFRSLDGGETWAQVGLASPIAGPTGRITLGVQPTNPDVVFAQLSDGSVYRYDVSAGLGNNWTRIAGEPAGYVGTQGFYDLAMAVASDDGSTLYLGGSTIWAPPAPQPGVTWSGAVYRASVDEAAATMAPVYIGTSTHADIHALVVGAAPTHGLWVGTDGGVFFSSIPQRVGAGAALNNLFQSMNTGLSTMTVNHLGQHPTQDAIAFASTQDNGVPQFTGGATWAEPNDPRALLGDSGYVVVNAQPAGNGQAVLATYTYNTIFSSADGGRTYAQITGAGTPRIALPFADSANFYAPLAGSTALMPNRVIFGSRAPWCSDDFGQNWLQIGGLLGPPGVPNTDFNINAIALSDDGLNLYVGTNNGQVYRYVDAGGWGVAALLNPPGTFPASPVTSIAVDPGNVARIYVTLAGNSAGWGGVPGWQRVWYYDGVNWVQRSGGAAGVATQLLDVQHNSVAIFDRAGALELYVGADVGVWKSTNGGLDWSPMSWALPEAAVIDLKVFPNAGPANLPLLRAGTHGRGVFEYVLGTDLRFARPVQLYVRATVLDRGLYPVQDGAISPIDPLHTVNHRDGIDIKLLRPAGGPDSDSFAVAADALFPELEAMTDQSRDLRVNTRARVFVQVHNRGAKPADGVFAQIILTKRPFITPPPPANVALAALAAPPEVPPNLQASVEEDILVQDPEDNWRGAFILARDDVRAGFPEVLSVDLPQSTFRAPGAYCLMVILHAEGDPFTSDERDADILTVNEPKVAMKYLFVR